MNRAGKLIIASVAVLSLGAIAWCGLHSSGIFNSDDFFSSDGSTEERIRVSLNTSDGEFDVKQSGGRFTVSRKGKKVLMGKFTPSALYDQYAEHIREATEADGVKDVSVRNNVISWTYAKGKKHEVNRIYKMSEKTAASITSRADKKTAEDAYSRLRFTVMLSKDKTKIPKPKKGTEKACLCQKCRRTQEAEGGALEMR